MPGRRRIASRPPKTWISSAVYSLFTIEEGVSCVIAGPYYLLGTENKERGMGHKAELLRQKGDWYKKLKICR